MAAHSRITVNGMPFAVVGVMPPDFVGAEPGRTPDVWIPAIDSPALTPWGYRPPGAGSLMSARAYWWLQVMGRVAPGVPLSRVQAELDPLLRHFASDALRERLDARSMPHLMAVPAVRGHDQMTRTYQKPLLILMAVVAVVLLTACANVATLLLARSSARRREIAIRLSIGASRGRLIRLFLTESVVLATLGAGAGLVVASWSARALVLLLPAAQQPEIAISPLRWRVLLFTLGVSVVTALAFGLAPSIGTTRAELARDITSVRPSGSVRRGTLGGGLVVAQVALSLVLVFGAGVSVRSLVRLHREDLGIDSRHVLVATLDATQNGYSGERLTALYETILERLQRVPGVQTASASRTALFTGWVSNGPMAIPGLDPKPTGMSIHWNGVAPLFAETMGLRMRLGRPIDIEDVRAAKPVAVINEAAAEYFFTDTNPIGRTFTFGQTSNVHRYEIVGVIQNAKYSSVRGPVPRTAYVPLTNMPATLAPITVSLKTTTEPLSISPVLRRTLHDIDPGLSVESVGTEEDQVSASLWQDRMFADLMTGFGVLAVLLASVGLYGTMSYTVARRTREIGMRMAIGAQRWQVSWLVLRDACLLTLIGIAVGMPLTLAALRLLASQLFGVSSADPIAMMFAVAALLAIMSGAAAFPAYRASCVDPLVSLKAE